MAKIRQRCEVCLRRLSPRKLTILHDDQGEHLLCEPCEERWSRQLMTFFARDLMAWSQFAIRHSQSAIL